MGFKISVDTMIFHIFYQLEIVTLKKKFVLSIVANQRARMKRRERLEISTKPLCSGKNFANKKKQSLE